MDLPLVIVIWIANFAVFSAAHDNFQRQVRREYEHGRKISGWNSRALWIRQVKGSKRSPSLKELERWWKGHGGKPKGAWKPSRDLWGSLQAESASNGFVPIGWRPLTKGRKFPRKKAFVPRHKVYSKGIFSHVKPRGPLRHPKKWTPRKIKEFIPHMRDVPTKSPSWVQKSKHPEKDYVPLMKDYVPLMKDLIPKTVEFWPPVSKCWPPTPDCDTFHDDISTGPKEERSVDLEMEKPPLMVNFFSPLDDSPMNNLNSEDTGPNPWNGPQPEFNENWNSINSHLSPLSDPVDSSPKEEWPPLSFGGWTPAVHTWTTFQNHDIAPHPQDWKPFAPVPVEESAAVAPPVGVNSFLGWKLTSNGWTPPSDYDRWTPVSNWKPLAEWSPPQNTIIRQQHTWLPPVNEWEPLTQEWTAASPLSHGHGSHYRHKEPISITTEKPIQDQPVTYWNPPSPVKWAQMTTNWAKEIKGLINQVTHNIF